MIYDDINEKILSVVLPPDTPLSWIFPKREVAERVLFSSPIPEKGNMSVRQVNVEVLENQPPIETEETDIAKENTEETMEPVETEITELPQEGSENV